MHARPLYTGMPVTVEPEWLIRHISERAKFARASGFSD